MKNGQERDPIVLDGDDLYYVYLANVALQGVNGHRAVSSTHEEESGHGVWDSVHKGDLRPLCYEHHIRMEFSQILPTFGGLKQLAGYFCPATGCSVGYNRRDGYFMMIPRREYTDRDIIPCVSCPGDGRLMYLAQIKPDKRSFRLWRCPHCKMSRTNREIC
jgi:hypothetical protein